MLSERVDRSLSFLISRRQFGRFVPTQRPRPHRVLMPRLEVILNSDSEF